MRAIELFSLAWSQTLKVRARLFLIPVLSLLLLPGFHTIGQPVVTVRFANPEFVCTTQTYSVDVEFNCNTASKQLFGFNISFYYPDTVLEFLSFGEFHSAYASSIATTLSTGNSSSGMTLFGFPGPSERVNGAVQKITSTAVNLPTTGWLKLFNASFHVDDPSVISLESFCPPLVWDMKENPANGGISLYGLTITLVVSYPNTTTPATVNVNQFNWQYDGLPGYPHGNPAPTDCMDPNCACAPDTYLPILGFCAPGTVCLPVIVRDFEAVGAFTLTFEYDPAVMTYVSNTPNAIFTPQNGLLTVTDLESTGGKKKITMSYDGNTISLADSVHLTDLHFDYISGSIDLTWITDGISCKYFDANNVPLNDQPFSNFYFNGNVISLQAPITKIDSTVALTNNFVTFTVRVWDFNNIHTGLLTLSYNPNVLVFQDASPHTAISNSFEVEMITAGMLEMDWLGSSISLADGSILMYLTFQYLDGFAPMIWIDDGPSCQYVNSVLLVPLVDGPPTEDYYINGNVTNAEFIWTGETSNDWNTCSNWVNNVIPDQYTTVIIDPTSTRTGWPTFTGNFTLGEQCKNLSLVGNAQFSVTGDFTIMPGNILDMTGSGILQIGGNWTNSGIFYPGTGTIEFTGTEDGTIAEGVPPGNYVAGYVLSSDTTGMIAITGGFAGPTGDNEHSDVGIGFAFNYLGINYSQVRINTNGWISLNLTGDDGTSFNNTFLFNTSAPETALAPWWDDLNADGSSAIIYKTEGTAPFRVFTAEWKNILSYSSIATARLNFQVKLYETTNIIEFHYGSITGTTHNTSEGASIGIKDATGGFGNFIEATRNSTNIILSFLKSETDWPVDIYRFSPPVVNDMELFYKVIASKTAGKLNIARDVAVTGTD